MKKHLKLFCFTIFISANAFAQNTNNFFEIIPSNVKIQNSLYKTLNVLDSRLDTAHFGIVQLGAFNRKTEVKVNKPIETQLQKALNNQLDSTAQNGKLLFQIREFYFAEITGPMSEKGYCYLKADLYSNNNNTYKKLAHIDTVSVVSTMDVTRLLMRSSSKLITDFIANNLTQKPAEDETYTFTDIVKIDSIEKTKIKLYTSNVLKDGVYNSYENFKIQEPNVKGFSLTHTSNYQIFIEKDGKKKNIRSKEIYAFVKDGNPFIATEYGYYPLIKREDNFYFSGKVKTSANNASVMTASIFFGVIGGLIASIPGNEISELKIDHQTGEFIREKIAKK